MGLERLHLKHSSKGWQLRAESQNTGEVFQTKAEAIAAAEKLAKESSDGVLVILERPQPHATFKRTRILVGSLFNEKDLIPRQRFPKKNPGTVQLISRSGIHLEERAAKFRNWTSSHSEKVSLPESAFDRESFYEDHD